VKSLAVEGQVSRHTYIAPPGRTATELLRNYKLEFMKIAEEEGLSQILAYNEADERMILGNTRDAKPRYYVVFVTSYKDG
jgi:hypothetical protein